MRKKRTIGQQLKRNARNAAKQTLYMMIWGEEPPKKYKKIKKL